MGVFTTDIDVALGRPGGMGGNGHALDQGEGVALHHHPVGKGAAIPLIGITDDEFSAAVGAKRSARHSLPFKPGGKAGPAAPAQARLDNLIHHLLGRQRAGPRQTLPAAGSSVIVEAERANTPCPRKSQPRLAGNERTIGDGTNAQRAGAGDDGGHIHR